MAWLFLVLALAALWMAFTATTTGGLAFGLLVALAMFAAFVLKLASDRIGNRARDEQLMLDPEELRRLREQAEARRLAAATQNEPPRG
jgi:membrane protein implicated in regulation of membrane protease activity